MNLAVRRTPRPHVTIKYLEPDFTELFLNGLRGLGFDGFLDTGYRGRELTRNAAVGGLALATGLRLQEFSHLLTYEVPPLTPIPVPVPFLVPVGVTKGRKFRTTWISYEALASVAQRYAVDWEQADDGGHIYVGDGADPNSYMIFGVHHYLDPPQAVHDGRALACRTGIPAGSRLPTHANSNAEAVIATAPGARDSAPTPRNRPAARLLRPPI